MGLFKKLVIELEIPVSKRPKFFLKSLTAPRDSELLDGPAATVQRSPSPPDSLHNPGPSAPHPAATAITTMPSPQQLPPEVHAKCLRDRTCFLCKMPGHHRKDCPMGDLSKRIPRPVDRYDPSPAAKPLVASAAELLPQEGEVHEAFEPDPRPHFNCKIGDEDVRVIADTGANCTTTNTDFKPSHCSCGWQEVAASAWSRIDIPLPPTRTGQSFSVCPVRVYGFPDAPLDITLGMDVLKVYIIDPQLKQPLLPRPSPG
ncbi:hypothetical protein PAPYR_12444 [Paratrimastix pyriformis]|uniref:CCHC-type domain-containing protein n=1 Tax=Paratrimastix pyriformis TaxID=342808 RepID=A0ABQ8U1W3_9EUKA|nr:hypothetical protein PAPYR_12444 [Paratrimastix pyriformis]